MSVNSILLILAWFAIAVLALVSAHLIAAVHILRSQLGASSTVVNMSPVRLGADIPAELEVLRTGNSGLHLLFVESRCLTCRDVAPHFVEMALLMGDLEAKWVVVSSDSTDWLPLPDGVELLANREDLFHAVGAFATPFGVSVSAQGTVATSPLGSAEAMRQFFSEEGDWSKEAV